MLNKMELLLNKLKENNVKFKVIKIGSKSGNYENILCIIRVSLKFEVYLRIYCKCSVYIIEVIKHYKKTDKFEIKDLNEVFAKFIEIFNCYNNMDNSNNHFNIEQQYFESVKNYIVKGEV